MKSISFSLKLTVLVLCFFTAIDGLDGQKVNPDTLNLDQLNLYLDKAGKLRNAGIIMTFSGVGIIAAGYLTSVIMANSGTSEDYRVLQSLIPLAIGAYVGIPISLIGIISWNTGAGRKKKAEIALQKFKLPLEKSMALGVGITIRF